MVQWRAPALQARLAIIDMNIIFLLLGLYGWEYFQSFDVEYAVIRGRLSFRWPLIPYIVGRMFQFVSLLLLAIRTNPPSTSFICLPGAISLAVSADIALGCSSTNLMIRTWVIWKDSRLVHILLLIMALGHWIVLALDVTNLQATKLNGKCAVHVVRPEMNAIVFVYSLCYDFLVLVLSIVGLSRRPSKSPLMKRLRTQGLVYFVVAVVTYIPPTAFALLNVNHMVSMTGLSGNNDRKVSHILESGSGDRDWLTPTCLSTIASYRAVRSLLGLRTPKSSQASEESVENDVPLTSQIPVPTTTPTVIC
ncbi:hypothetical protein J3R83DRAFT_9603 [Lanmaoa asiatica]|nr:hypothetical protein J3R83DRAFT_9603 [Lanmaoa asiatica]